MISVKIFLEPFKDVVAVQVVEDALIQIGTLSACTVAYVVRVQRDLPHARVSLDGTGVDLALVRNLVVKRVRPNWLVQG